MQSSIHSYDASMHENPFLVRSPAAPLRIILQGRPRPLDEYRGFDVTRPGYQYIRFNLGFPSWWHSCAKYQYYLSFWFLLSIIFNNLKFFPAFTMKLSVLGLVALAISVSADLAMMNNFTNQYRIQQRAVLASRYQGCTSKNVGVRREWYKNHVANMHQ